jgi:WD40 repeat protein
MWLFRRLPRISYRHGFALLAAFVSLGTCFTFWLAMQVKPRALYPTIPHGTGWHGGFYADHLGFVTMTPSLNVTIWDPDTGAVRSELACPFTPSTQPGFAPDGSTWALAGSETTGCVFDRATGKVTTFLDGHDSRINQVVYAPDSRSIVTCTTAGGVSLWDIATNKESPLIVGSKRKGAATAFSADGRTLVAASWVNGNGLQEHYELRLWNTATGQELNAFPVPPTASAVSLAISSDGRTVTLSEGTGPVHIWEAATGHEQATCQIETQVHRTAFSPDGRSLAVSYISPNSRDARLARYMPAFIAQFLHPMRRGTTVFDASTGQAEFTLPGSIYPAFAADGRTLYTFSYDTAAIALWDVPPARAIPLWVGWLLVSTTVIVAGAAWRGERLMRRQPVS